MATVNVAIVVASMTRVQGEACEEDPTWDAAVTL